MRIYEVLDEAICSRCGEPHKDELTKYNASEIRQKSGYYFSERPK